MKEEKTKRQKYMLGIGAAIVVILLIAITGGLFLGKKAENGEIENQQSTDAVIIQQAEESEEETTESVEKVRYATAKEWVDSLELEKPTLLIWNEKTLEHCILEMGAEYQLKENDKILLGGVGGMKKFECNPGNIFNGFATSPKGYADILLEIEGRQEVSMALTVKEKEYELTATFIGVSGEIIAEEEITTIDEIDVHSDLPGEEWAASLGIKIEVPFMAVWNDTEGTKKILEDGENYQLKEGDMIFVYCPEYAYLEMMIPEDDSGMTMPEFIKEATETENGWIVEFDRSYIEQKGEVKVNVYIHDDEIVKLTYTFTK